MQTFIGHPTQEGGRKFLCHNGYILTFSHPLNLYEDFNYVILCSRDSTTKEFTLIKVKYWWNPLPED